jgi:hypothetical protein
VEAKKENPEAGDTPGLLERVRIDLLLYLLRFYYFHVCSGQAELGAVFKFCFQDTHHGFGFHLGEFFG